MIKLLAAAEVRTREILRWLCDSRIYPESFGPEDVFLTTSGKVLRLKELSEAQASRLLWVPTREQLRRELIDRGWQLELRELGKSAWLAVLSRPDEPTFYLEGVGHDEEHAVLSVLERWKALLVPELIGDAT